MFSPKRSGNAADERVEEHGISAHQAPTVPARSDTSAEIRALSAKIEDLQKQISDLVTAQQDRT
jgi:hypothetical protein